MSCELCGFEPKYASSLVDGRCKSYNACLGRLRSGKHLKRPVRLALEIATQLDPDTREAIANIREAERIAREIRRALYINGLCTDCAVVHHSPGRPRCEPCHKKYLIRRAAMG